MCHLYYLLYRYGFYADGLINLIYLKGFTFVDMILNVYKYR